MRRVRSLLWIVAAILVSAPAAAVAADAVTARLQTCRAIADVAARAACYDKVVDDQAVPPRAAAATPATPSPAPPSPAVRSPATPPPVPSTPAPATPATIPAQPSTLTAKVVTFTPGPTGKATITLDNGQVWTQIEPVRLTLRPGDGVTLRPGSFGSYFLVPDGLRSTFRVTLRR